MKKNLRNKLYFGVYVLLNTVLLIQILRLETLPIMYNAVLVLSALIFGGILYYSQFKTSQLSLNRIGKFFLVLLSVLMLVGNIYIYQAGSLLDRVSGGQSKKDTVSIVVRESSPYKTLDDLKGMKFGIEDSSEVIIKEAIEYFESKSEQKISTKDFKDYTLLAKSLLENDIEVIILNEAYRNIIEDDYPEFSQETRVIAEYNKETLITVNRKFNVVKDPFTVMISGIDVYGSISNNARSDVNILATINPTTKKILLLSIPRDYYLPFTCQQGALDKLTHTGIYGIDCTMETIGEAFDVNIDYYARVNFSSLIKVVDALDGVTVNADYGFTSGNYSFSAGENYLRGNQALAFVRDRKHQADGDLGRGRNQMKVLTAIINKMTSPAIITNFSGIISSLDGSFQTNMTSKEITSLVKMQLKDMESWDIEQIQVTGTGASDYSYALGGNYYVMYPDQESVNIAKAAIKDIQK